MDTTNEYMKDRVERQEQRMDKLERRQAQILSKVKELMNGG